MNIHARIAALHRELADAYQELADEFPRPKRAKRNQDATAIEAARKVREGLRRKGFTDGKQAT